jgi:hypothetical protein
LPARTFQTVPWIQRIVDDFESLSYTADTPYAVALFLTAEKQKRHEFHELEFVEFVAFLAGIFETGPPVPPGSFLMTELDGAPGRQPNLPLGNNGFSLLQPLFDYDVLTHPESRNHGTGLDCPVGLHHEDE